MKKIIINSVAIMLLMVSFTSCNDAIDIEPVDQLTPEITFETVDDLQQGLNGVYGQYGFEADITFNSVFADNCKVGYDNGGQLINLYNWVMTAGTAQSTTLWTTYYSMINGANRILEASDLIDVDPADQAQLANIRGQLYALRAAAHYHLLTYFTTDYSDENALSIIISDEVPIVTDVFPRNTTGEVFDFIESDLELASSLIATSQTDITRATRDFVTGLRARVSLLRGQNGLAMSYAQDLIDAYPLANQSQYFGMFADTDNTEVIMKLARPSSLVSGIWYFTNSAGPFMEASNSLYDSFDPSDIRLQTCINFSTNNAGPSEPENNIHLINKYPGNPSGFISDIKNMRVAEMHLIKAEAQALSGDFEDCAITLKGIRDARLGTSTDLDVYTGVAQAASAVLLERRKELAFEGQRYLDIKRLRNVVGQGIVRAEIDCQNGGNCVLPISDQRFTLPIPQVELNANPGITQNPGYGN
ncbi:RagB/SusD family nutrient uptake outer membrane protein [Psychroserpens sp. BH13MA-6]